jgi:hypothetical protein
MSVPQLAVELPQSGPIGKPPLEQQEGSLLVGRATGQVGHVIPPVRQPVVVGREETNRRIGRDGAIEPTTDIWRSACGRSRHEVPFSERAS